MVKQVLISYCFDLPSRTGERDSNPSPSKGYIYRTDAELGVEVESSIQDWCSAEPLLVMWSASDRNNWAL